MSTPETLPDDVLIAAALRGEREAFSVLVRRHQEALFHFARGMGTAADTAEDLVQDTFIRAWSRLWQCRDGVRFRAWLLTILRHLVIDHARDVRRGMVPLDAVDPARLVHADESGDAIELRGALGEALAALPDLLREAFLLRHLHGYGYDEIAEITGAGVSAVKMRVHRAREQLRAALGDDASVAVASTM